MTATHIKVNEFKEELRAAQMADNDIKEVANALAKSNKWVKMLSAQHQLTMVNGAVCQKYSPGM